MQEQICVQNSWDTLAFVYRRSGWLNRDLVSQTIRDCYLRSSMINSKVASYNWYCAIISRVLFLLAAPWNYTTGTQHKHKITLVCALSIYWRGDRYLLEVSSCLVALTRDTQLYTFADLFIVLYISVQTPLSWENLSFCSLHLLELHHYSLYRKMIISIAKLTWEFRV